MDPTLPTFRPATNLWRERYTVEIDPEEESHQSEECSVDRRVSRTYGSAVPSLFYQWTLDQNLQGNTVKTM